MPRGLWNMPTLRMLLIQHSPQSLESSLLWGPVLSQGAGLDGSICDDDLLLKVRPAGKFLSREWSRAMKKVTEYLFLRGEGGDVSLFPIATHVSWERMSLLTLHLAVWQQGRQSVYRGCYWICQFSPTKYFFSRD